MESGNAQNQQEFMDEVADALDAAADELDSNGEQTSGDLTISQSGNGGANFVQKLVYSTFYSASFGACFPVFLACRYVPKQNPLVQGMIAGGSAATHDVDAWLERTKQYARDKAEQSATTGGVAPEPA